MRTDAATFPGAARLLAELVADSAGIRNLKATDTADPTEHGGPTEPSRPASTSEAETELPSDSPVTEWPLREPADLQDAMRRAETSARRLRAQRAGCARRTTKRSWY